MSCRVLQRGVEQFSRNELVELARAEQCARILGTYIPSAKNALVERHYESLEFERTGTDGGMTFWSLDRQYGRRLPLPHVAIETGSLSQMDDVPRPGGKNLPRSLRRPDHLCCSDDMTAGNRRRRLGFARPYQLDHRPGKKARHQVSRLREISKMKEPGQNVGSFLRADREEGR